MSITYKILIADDHPMVRDGIKLLLETHPEITAEVYESSNGKELLELLSTMSFDLILLDISMPIMDGIETLTKIKNELHIETPVLMLSSFKDKHLIVESNNLGANGYVLKNAAADELIEGINQAIKRQKFFSKEIAEILLQTKDDEIQKKIQALTPREKEILVLITKELSNQAIADELHISPRTVEGHRERLLKKLNLSSTIGLVKFAMKNGFTSE